MKPGDTRYLEAISRAEPDIAIYLLQQGADFNAAHTAHNEI